MPQRVFVLLSSPLWLCVGSVLGPALTFRIRQNEQNMTAAEVAAKAGRFTHSNAVILPSQSPLMNHKCLKKLKEAVLHDVLTA